MKGIALLPVASLALAACQEATRPDVEGPIALPSSPSRRLAPRPRSPPIRSTN